MVKKNKVESWCTATAGNMPYCRVESILSVDERGQMVLPKELREKAQIKPGDKLALISWEKDGKICCFSLIKAEEMTGMVKSLLGPLMSDIQI
ncbi:MAG: HgcAB-associated protein [Chloroflexi bacterium]|nr:HgcAB-associated protein [Chloroflexota bacterium]